MAARPVGLEIVYSHIPYANRRNADLEPVNMEVMVLIYLPPNISAATQTTNLQEGRVRREDRLFQGDSWHAADHHHRVSLD